VQIHDEYYRRRSALLALREYCHYAFVERRAAIRVTNLSDNYRQDPEYKRPEDQ